MEDFLNYRYYKAQDFVWDESFRSWVLWAKPEDTLYWTRFVVYFPEKEEEINLAIDIILQMTVKEPDLSDGQIDEIKEKVMQKIHLHECLPVDTTLRRKPNKRKVPLLTAAALLVAIATTMLITIVQPDKTSHRELVRSTVNGDSNWMGDDEGLLIEKTNFSGEAVKIVMPDQSEITLENGSSIRYAQTFESNGPREIYLVGSAFFDVTKDVSRPFLVYGDGIATKVLGTSFRVNAPKDGNERPTVEVVSGVVAVYPLGDKNPKEVMTGSKIGEIILTRNQKAEYSKTHNTLVTALVDHPLPLPNKMPMWRFDNHPILDILDTLSTDYGVDIIHDDVLLAGRTLTADLSGLTMYQKLDVICQAVNAGYEVINGKVIIL